MDDIFSDENTQKILLAFAIGAAFGWFIRSFIKTKEINSRSQSLDSYEMEYDRFASEAEKIRRRNEYRSKDGKTVDDIEAEARRRL